MSENVCNMEEVMNIELHREGDKYYITLFADDCYDKVGLPRNGVWCDSHAIPKNKLNNLFKALADIKYH